MMVDKACTKCGECKPLEEFNRRPDARDGRTSHCKVCKRAHRRTVAAQKAEYDKRYHLEHRERKAEYRRRWYQENREAAIENVLRWRKENPERLHLNSTVWKHRARAREEDAPGGHFTSDEWAALCEAYGNLCLRCGEAKPLTVDHIVPLSQGGGNDIENIQPLCRACNTSKGRQIMDYRGGGVAIA